MISVRLGYRQVSQPVRRHLLYVLKVACVIVAQGLLGSSRQHDDLDRGVLPMQLLGIKPRMPSRRAPRVLNHGE